MLAAREGMRNLAPPREAEASVLGVLHGKAYVPADAPALAGVVERSHAGNVACESAVGELRAHPAADGKPVVYLVREPGVDVGCVEVAAGALHSAEPVPVILGFKTVWGRDRQRAVKILRKPVDDVEIRDNLVRSAGTLAVRGP